MGDNRTHGRPEEALPVRLASLAEINATGLRGWSPGLLALLDDPQRSSLRPSTVANLISAGYLEDTGEANVKVTAAGRELLERNPEARGRAEAIHEKQQVLFKLTGKSVARQNTKSVPRP